MENHAETVTLQTHRFNFGYAGRPLGVPILPAEIVISVDSPRLEYQVQEKYPYPVSSDDVEQEWKLPLPLEVATNLGTYYRRTMVRTDGPSHECHSLARFVWGLTDIIEKSDGIADPQLWGEQVRPCDLIAGQPYAMISDDGANVHEMLGLGAEYPRYSLSVLGGDGPLAVTNTVKTMDTFGGICIRPLLYEGTPLTEEQ